MIESSSFSVIPSIGTTWWFIKSCLSLFIRCVLDIERKTKLVLLYIYLLYSISEKMLQLYNYNLTLITNYKICIIYCSILYTVVYDVAYLTTRY